MMKQSRKYCPICGFDEFYQSNCFLVQQSPVNESDEVNSRVTLRVFYLESNAVQGLLFEVDGFR